MQTFLCIYFGINLFVSGYAFCDSENGDSENGDIRGKIITVLFLFFGVPLVIFALIHEYWTQIKAFFVEVVLYIFEAIDLIFRGIIIVFTFFVLWFVASGFFKTCL